MEILKRADVPQEFTWDLTPVFANDDAWFAEYEALKALPERIAEYRGTLGKSAKGLLAFLKFEDEVTLRLSSLLGYASCKGDEDTSNNFYQDMRGKATGTWVNISGALSFATPEIMAIDEKVLDSFYKDEPELETYRRSLYQIRRRAAHILSDEGEKLLAAAGEMADAPDRIRSTFSDADLTFDDVVDGQGNVHHLTDGTLVPLLESTDVKLRENTFKTFYKRMGEFKNTVASTLDAQFKQLRFFAGARKYSSTLEASLDVTEVPVSVYTNLIEAVHANLDKMYKYVALRKKLLGVDELHMYDVYTPIIEYHSPEIPFEEAKDIVLKGLAPLGEDYLTLLREGFDNRWIDIYENQGKRSGAYSTCVYGFHPYVLLNYQGNLDNVFTLAHEMGHSLHSCYTNASQTYVNSNYNIFVAEIASTCNEYLLISYLLEKAETKEEKAYLLNHLMDQFKGTLFRQTMFAEFEKITHEKEAAGEALTCDTLCKVYKDLNKLYFGPDMVIDEEIAMEWARIPHFYTPFYVYQYATGISAAIAFGKRILSGEPGALEDYKRFLSGGCSMDCIDLLKSCGIDMTTTEPTRAALKVFDSCLSELENLF